MFDAVPIPDPIALQQSDGFERALTSMSNSPLRLSDGTLVLQRKFGGLPLRMIARPRSETVTEIAHLVRAVPGHAPVIVTPECPLPLHKIGAMPLVSPNTIAVLELGPPLDVLEAGLHQKWRNRLRHAEKQKLRVTRQTMPDDANHWLFQADAVQQRQRGYRSWPTGMTLAFCRENPGDAKLFTAFWDRTAVAAVLILRHGSSITYHIGHTSVAGRKVSAHCLLLWSVIRWAKAKNLQRFELGTLDTEEGQGIARFKLGTGARAHGLGGTWLWWPPLTALCGPVARLDRSLMQVG